MNPLPCRKISVFGTRGFALVVTLSLMMLLTVIAVGLLSLSGVSLRSSLQHSAMQEARANARMSLLLALGDLQKHMGPDTRVCATADQIPAARNGEQSAAASARRQWTGAYQSWPAATPASPRPKPAFLQWFVSGNPDDTQRLDFAREAPHGSSVDIVSRNTVDSGDPVTVPAVRQRLSNGTSNRFAWWIGDQGSKALILESKPAQPAIAGTRADMQSPSTARLRSAESGGTRPFQGVRDDDPALSLLTSWRSAELLGTNPRPTLAGGLFHDFSTFNRGLLTNVRSGGFRKDLSMELERPLNQQPDPNRTALYKAGSEPGINFQELWAYYNICSRVNSANKGLRWSSASIPFTTGGTMSPGTPYLELPSSASACQQDDFFFFKQPVIIGYQIALSLQTRIINGVNRLHVVTDPILTFWNPLDVPVVVPQGLVFTVKYWQIPYDLRITRNGTILDLPVAGISRSDGNFLSLRVGSLERLVFRPGEVIKVSQYRDLLARGEYSQDIHALDGKKGFLYGKGMAWEAGTRSGAKVDVGPNDRLVFQSAIPNNLTAGATASDGNSITGAPMHTRHFSITHHEYYVGADRNTESLGIGGMYLDWDFGNQRLGTSQSRAMSDPGTKPRADRYYANQRPEVFKTFNDGRTIPTGGSKMPVMLLAFNVRTETSQFLNNRCFSRFNPKALHVDFYDLNKAEREMMPYEYRVELLNGWKSADDSLQQDASGRGYFGAAMNAQDGCNFFTTHSIPREPPVSLAAFQHSFANGFNIQKPKYGYATLNAREPLLPQISHAIGNSLACPVLAPAQTVGSVSGGRPVADHSYLANQALWDDWFLSGISPQTNPSFARQRSQKEVAADFFEVKAGDRLPVARYLPEPGGSTAGEIVDRYFGGTRPKDSATHEIARYLSVEGMFNVNSTSIEAWKSILSSRFGRPMVKRDENGKESGFTSGEDVAPVSNLMAPADFALDQSHPALGEPSQWVGYRALNESDVESLARAVVREVRKRGPFLSLADFINRRAGNDPDLAKSGAIQSALDAEDVTINSAFHSGARSSSGAEALAFPQAEKGPMSYGAPGIVKQADILTPIAPILSARSDTFIIRGYGEKSDKDGKPLARAWCEAIVQRTHAFVDPSDAPEEFYTDINRTNRAFGRRFQIVTFRWLTASEA